MAHNFKKSLGQNFIFDTNLLKSIVSDALVCRGDVVVEVGAGAGTLTKALADVAKKVLSFEVDKDLIEPLTQLEKERTNLKFIFEDALKFPIERIHESIHNAQCTMHNCCENESKKSDNNEKFPSIEGNYNKDDNNSEFCILNSELKYKLVANLPYYITTPLLFKFLDDEKCESLTMMMQKEVALRVSAKENTADYGILSVICQAMADITYNRTVSRKMFTPPPNVDSAVITLKRNLKILPAEVEHFKRVVKSAFAMRRKTLSNNLMKEFSLPREKILNILQKMGKNENIRGETLSVGEFIELTRLIQCTMHNA